MSEGVLIPAKDAPPPALTAEQADAAVKRAVRVWAAGVRDRIDPFVDETFSLQGALRLHRHALGWDLVRAPANLALAVPALLQVGGASLLRRAGRGKLADRLTQRSLFLETKVAREIAWVLHTELLHLPIDQGDRRSDRDGLAEAVLSDPAIAAALGPDWRALAEMARDPDRKAKLEAFFTQYTGSRTAASDIVSALAAVGGGAAAFQSFTPSMISLGPLLAGVLAHHLAIASFPLGASLGGVWYGLFPASVSAAFTATVTGATLGIAAVLAAFAGIVADPVQRRLGVHRKRLNRLVDAIEKAMLDGEGDFTSRGPYVARVFDAMEVLRQASRATGG
ncbi:MAG: hypothetical protein NXI16_13280 [Alphaproteobacteria bacterium]|nr:hypothetical protein [Alphaproteobacteria bacterium]